MSLLRNKRQNNTNTIDKIILKSPDSNQNIAPIKNTSKLISLKDKHITTMAEGNRNSEKIVRHEALTPHVHRLSLDSSIITSSRPRRQSFASVGKKVTSIIRTKMAFKMKKTIPEDSKVEDEIHELPKNPRFSSFLSPEAQFAIMKGYEDVLHREIATSHPKYRPHIRRCKTPVQKIDIKKSGKTDLKYEEEEDVMGLFGQNESWEQKSFDNIGSNYFRNTSIKSNVCTRRASVPSTMNFYGFTNSANARPRIKSSPSTTISRGQRLVLTYRLESAMDILDTIRDNTGSTPISPRVRDAKRQITPLQDYSIWANVWHKEFDCSHENAKFEEINPRQYIRA